MFESQWYDQAAPLWLPAEQERVISMGRSASQTIKEWGEDSLTVNTPEL